ncbi:uridine kinase family protein [Actinokineospora sp.]|uniref:uridine kinase family protein n=1 Tax=Actinokineospora sp. TaxID=1872133 RepID=UPI0040383AD9
MTTALVPTDHFATWTDPVAWWPRLVDGVLTPLAAGRPGRYQAVAWSDGTPRLGEWITVEVPDVLVLEGVSAGRRSIEPLLSALAWVELPEPAVRLARAVARDGEACRAELVRWQAFETGWFAVDGTRDRASVTLVS